MKKVLLTILALLATFLLFIEFLQYGDDIIETKDIDHHLPFHLEQTFENNTVQLADFNENGLEQGY